MVSTATILMCFVCMKNARETQSLISFSEEKAFIIKTGTEGKLNVCDSQPTRKS